MRREGRSRLRLFGALLWLAVMAPTTAGADNPAVTVTVDASADRRPISPNVYGVAFGSATTLTDLNVPLNRSGGNHTSRYNWQLNADNRAFDWYFESLPYPSGVAGEVGDTFIAQSRAAGAEPMLTIPMVGWVAKLGPGRSRLSSFSIAKYGAQSGNDWQWFPDAGNGVRPNGQDVTGNDPNDANVPADSAFQLGWMQHLTTRWGRAGEGGLRYYLLDNEPSIWFETHRDVHPTGLTMEEARDTIVDYARRVKDNDPGALVFAPEEWGWDGYRFSGYDQQQGSLNNWSSFPDRAAHGGWDYLPWLLDQLRLRDVADGRRLLDVFSVHYYPQGGEFSDNVSEAMQLRRNTSTRSLWDPSYVDQSWIADRVRLIPRLRGWVDTYYPGTGIAVTEYNWGAEGHINGATAQADVLGIFGREGLDVAVRWTTPSPATPTYKAIKMYRNYDGNRSTFGDTSVRATGPNPDVIAPFAALRAADGALTIMVVTKALTGATPTTISLASFTAGSLAQAWQLTSANTITRLADVPVTGGMLSATLPPQSITLIVVPPGSSAAPLATTGAATGITTGGATLNGTVNPRGLATTVVFQWGTTTAYGSTTGLQSIGSGTAGLGVSASLTGLAPGTTYHHRIVATNSAGTTSGADVAFTTTAPLTYTLTVASTNPGSGVPITISPADTSGQGNGTTPVSRVYAQNAVVNLTAPASAGANTFQKWRRDGVDVSTATGVQVTMDTGHILTAVYVTPGAATLSLAYNGKLRDRVGAGNTALAADGALDGTLTATLSASGGRTVTGLSLQSSAPGTWDTTSGTAYYLLGAASTLDGALLNTAGTMAVSFAVANGGSFVVFASDPGGGQFVPGRTLTLTATFSDGTTATATTTVPSAPPVSVTLAYNGKLRDRVGAGNTALGPDGALDGTLTATLTASGGRTVTGLSLQSSTPGTWDTTSATAYYLLGAASTFDGALFNTAGTMAVSFTVADGASFAVFASDPGGSQFVPGRTLTLTAAFSDGTTATAVTTVPSAPPAGVSLIYNGKLRDRVGQGNTALGADGALDGTLTATLSASGGRTVTGLQLQSTTPGTWDTTSGTAYYLLGVASTLDGALLNTAGTMAVSFAVADGGSFVVFASDAGGGQFASGRTLTLTATFSDGTTATATTSVPAATLSLAYNGKLRDRVGQGNTALGADGALDGTLTATLSASGGRTVTGLQLQSSAPGTWDTTGATASYLLGAAGTLDGALLNTAGTMAVSFAVADGGSFVVFASDVGNTQFAAGRTLTLTATFSDGTTATAVATAP